MATNPQLILCNGAPQRARRPRSWASVQPRVLATFGRQANVNLKITDLTDEMFQQLAPAVHDLIELSALIYAADQSCRRTGGKTIDWGERWHRTFRFEVRVREPDFWNQDSVQNALVETLSFLSGDNYEFAFGKLKGVPPSTDYLDFKKASGLPDRVERVVLFSGGLDSLVGAVDEILENQRRVALVSHKPVDHLAVKQRKLVAWIAERAGDRRLRPLHFAVKANKSGDLSLENTQRSRSFLYAAMAVSVAEYFDLDNIYFYENGITSVNLPLCQQEIGSRATRTTHPQTLSGFERIFSALLGRQFKVRNEFLWMTKQDVLGHLRQCGQAELAQESLSCTHTRNFTLAAPHCGLCSQCLSRRVAALGAGLGDNDPASGYRSDVLLAPRNKDEDRILAERFVGVARQIESMASVEEFHESFAGELSRVYPYLDMPAQIAAEKLFDLHNRHAVQVGKVMLDQMVVHADTRRRGLLPDTCVLSYAFDAGRTAKRRVPAKRTKTKRPNIRSKPCICLGKPGEDCWVLGKNKGTLTDSQRAVLSALLEAGSKGLKKDSLERVRASARRILRKLREDEDWAKVIMMPGKTDGRYRVKS